MDPVASIDEGLESMRYYLKSRSKHALPPSDFIVRLTEWTLKNNVFCSKTACIDKKKVLQWEVSPQIMKMYLVVYGKKDLCTPPVMFLERKLFGGDVI